MHNVEVLPIAKQDLSEIARYVAVDLANPKAAERLVTKIIDGIKSLSALPYRHSVYLPIHPLEHEYRSLGVGNYLVFYWISEEPEPLVTVARILYDRSDAARHLA